MLPQARLALESSLASYQTGAVDFLSVLTNFGALLEYEMLSLDEVKKVLRGEAIERPTIDEPPRTGPAQPAGKRPHRGSVPTSRPGGIAPEPST